jgi:hypothetical protein
MTVAPNEKQRNKPSNSVFVADLLKPKQDWSCNTACREKITSEVQLLNIEVAGDVRDAQRRHHIRER